MSATELKARKQLLDLIAGRTLLPIKRYDPWLTLLRVQMLRCNFKVVWVGWER